MSCAVRLLYRTGKAISEDLELRRIWRLSSREGNEHDVVSRLRSRRTIPRAMARDERAILIVGRKRRARIEKQIVGRPVGGEERLWSPLRRAVSNGFATVAAVLGRENELLLLAVEVAGWPSIVAALHDL